MSKDWKEYDWSDVTPLPIPETPGNVAQIAYSDEFKEVFAVFRAASCSKEYSERVLALTTAVIKLNPAHYSVWDYRLDVCRRIGNSVFDYKAVGITPNAPNPPPIGDNGEWLNSFTLNSPKVYQVWNYRQNLIDPENIMWYKGEKLLVSMVLEDDSKNFHAWSHLKWCILQSLDNCPEAFDFEELFEVSNEMLKSDVFNNSVWSFRHFLHTLNNIARDPTIELQYVYSKITEAPDNESSWSYLNGLIVLFPFLKVEAVKKAQLFALERRPRALEFIAGASDAELANLYWEQLSELEPMRACFWKSNMVK